MEPVYGWRYQAEHLRIPPGAAGAVSGKISYVCEGRGKPAENRSRQKLPKPAGGACDGELCIPQADESGTRRHRVR
mgnify:FL=1